MRIGLKLIEGRMKWIVNSHVLDDTIIKLFSLSPHFSPNKQIDLMTFLCPDNLLIFVFNSTGWDARRTSSRFLSVAIPRDQSQSQNCKPINNHHHTGEGLDRKQVQLHIEICEIINYSYLFFLKLPWQRLVLHCMHLGC